LMTPGLYKHYQIGCGIAADLTTTFTDDDVYYNDYTCNSDSKLELLLCTTPKEKNDICSDSNPTKKNGCVG